MSRAPSPSVQSTHNMPVMHGRFARSTNLIRLTHRDGSQHMRQQHVRRIAGAQNPLTRNCCKRGCQRCLAPHQSA